MDQSHFLGRKMIAKSLDGLELKIALNYCFRHDRNDNKIQGCDGVTSWTLPSFIAFAPAVRRPDRGARMLHDVIYLAVA